LPLVRRLVPGGRQPEVHLSRGHDANGVGEPLDIVPPASASSLVLNAGGREYITQLDRTTSTTRLLLPSRDGALTPGLEVSGYPYGLIRLR
jgi:hypothetical protein